jgi:hypothetical protein
MLLGICGHLSLYLLRCMPLKIQKSFVDGFKVLDQADEALESC